MIRELLPIATDYDLQAGDVLEVHATSGSACAGGKSVSDAHQGMIIQGRTNLSAFASKWADASPWLNRVIVDDRLYAFAWLAIVHETGVMLVRTNLARQEATGRA